MCRYAMAPYKPHYACFYCRKTFKRRLLGDIDRDQQDVKEARCPQCGGLMANMGLDFKSPPKDDIKAWVHLQDLYSVGITFHSCGCSGPGYIPKDKECLIAYFAGILKDYHKQLDFWRKRIEPKTKEAVHSEKSKHWHHISRIPHDRHAKKDVITNEQAKTYWLEKINEVERKIKTINPGQCS